LSWSLGFGRRLAGRNVSSREVNSSTCLRIHWCLFDLQGFEPTGSNDEGLQEMIAWTSRAPAWCCPPGVNQCHLRTIFIDERCSF
jgi:hypothetical protein